MTTQEVANKLHGYCTKGQWKQAQKNLYANNAWSQEPSNVIPRTARGLDKMAKKSESWTANTKLYGTKVSKPVVAGNWFTMKMEMDMKMKNGPRTTASELCVYEVRDGKIVSEQFFYG